MHNDSPVSRRLLCAVLALSPTSLLAQTIQVVRADPSAGVSAMCLDEARGKIVAIGASGTLEWDGARWITRDTSSLFFSNPPPMAFDAKRQRMVIFTGHQASRTLEWDGTSWQTFFPTPAPVYCSGCCAGYDPVRERVVLVNTSNPKSTWEWDGAAWTQRFPATSPAHIPRPTMAWDGINNELMLYGGPGIPDIWNWNGSDWAQRFPATNPTAVPVDIATDPIRQRIVMVGTGRQGRETWEWDGVDWTQIPVPFTPASPKFLAWDPVNSRMLLGLGNTATDSYHYDGTAWSLVHAHPQWDFHTRLQAVEDPTRGVIVAVGRSSIHNDVATWEWDGFEWQHRSPANDPLHSFHAMSPNPATDRPMLFGGDAGFMGTTDQFLEWNGTNWLPIPTANRPSPRGYAAMALDTLRNKVVLVGGRRNTTDIRDTWEWDGVNWQQMAPAAQPAPFGRMAFDEARGVIVYVVRVSTQPVPGAQQTWEWDGASWSLRIPQAYPLQWINALYYDSARGQIMGRGEANASWLWGWTGTTWNAVGLHDGLGGPMVSTASRGIVSLGLGGRVSFQGAVEPTATSYGQGCSGASVIPTLQGIDQPALGSRRFELEITNGRPSTIGAVLLGASPASIPVGSCTLLTDPSSDAVPLFTNAWGVASLSFAIPAQPQLLGIAVSAQGVLLDGLVGAVSVSATNGVTIVLGN